MPCAEDKTVLVVEDEPDVQLYLKTVLEDAGFKVRTASDGEEALSVIRNSRPDFISLDLILPKRSGQKLLRELKADKDLADIPALILTAHAHDEFGRPELESIFDEVLLQGPGLLMEKPVNPANYVRCIQQSLGIEPQGEDEGRMDLKQELQGLLKDADAETLRRAMKVLKHNDMDASETDHPLR